MFECVHACMLKKILFESVFIVLIYRKQCKNSIGRTIVNDNAKTTIFGGWLAIRI